MVSKFKCFRPGISLLALAACPLALSAGLVIEAEDFDMNEGFLTQTTTDVGGGLNIAYANPGDILQYDVDVEYAGEYDITFRVAAATQNVSFDLLNGASVLATVDELPTGGSQTWVTTDPYTVTLPAGTVTLRIVANGRSWNLNWFEISPKESSLVIEAENYSSTNGFATQPTSDVGGGRNLKDASPGDTALYNGMTIPVAGYYEAKFRIASLNQNVRFDLKNGGTTLISVDQPATGGYQNWTTWTAPSSELFYLPAGNLSLTIESNGFGWNLNWFELNRIDAPSNPGPNHGRLNVVFLFADDLGPGDLAVAGHPYALTPNLDQLAAEGTRFEHFYMTGNVCGPSRTGIMTSRHPDTFQNDAARLGFFDYQTVTDIFKDDGYATGHFGKWHIGPDDNPGDVYNGLYGIDEVINQGGSSNDPRGRDNEIYDNAIDFIERHQDVPFFVNVWGYSTHTPVLPHEDLPAIFSDVVVDRSLFGPNMQDRFDGIEASGQNLNTAMRNYLGDVYGLDYAVGRLLAKLDELGLRENTIVVFSSDNGPARDTVENDNMIGWAGGLRGTKHTNWEGGVKSQLLVRLPGQVPANKVNDVSVLSSLDWLPTISSLAGIDINNAMFEGEDVSDVFLGSDRSRVNPIFYKFGGNTVVQDNWKLTYANGYAELFDLADDPNEMVDIAPQNAALVSQLNSILQDWKGTIVNTKNKDSNNIVPDPPQPAVIIGPAPVSTKERGGEPAGSSFTSANINFQPGGSAVPAGYVADASQTYAPRGNGFTYGWSESFNHTRDRNANSDQRLDTLNHMQKNGADPFWEIEVPNGVYSVTIVGGDPSAQDSFIELVAEEGTSNAVTLASGNASGVNFVSGSGSVTVSDGRLTISNGANAQNNKICYIQITKL